MVKTKLLMPVIVCALILTACGKEPMPEVNDVNCAPEKRKQIKDRETRQEFTELCWQVEHERAVKGEYKPLENPKKTWDELFAPADQGK